MKVVRRQGLVFCLLAAAFSGYIALAGPPSRASTIPVLALLIVALGIPHGALDALLAADLCRRRGVWWWVGFAAAYLATTLLVLAAWHWWPRFLLALFLVLSASHFGGDLDGCCPRWIRLLYGGAPTVLPAVFHGGELQLLFSWLIPAESAAQLVGVLGALAEPYLIAIGAAVILLARRRKPEAAEVAALSGLCLVAPPLLAFTIFFCGMHSARHILRCLWSDRGAAREGAASLLMPDRPSGPRLRRAVGLAAPPMAATLLLLWGYWEQVAGLAPEPRLVRTVFIGLAALTVPHVILVDGLLPRQNPA